MFNVKDAMALIGEDFKTPAELAKKLYFLIRNQDQNVGSPVNISVPPGQTGLTIGRSAPTPRNALSGTPSPTVRSSRAANQIDSSRPRPPVVTNFTPSGPTTNPATQLDRPPTLSDTSAKITASPALSDYQASPDSPTQTRQVSTSVNSHVQGQSAPGSSSLGKPPQSISPSAQFSKPYTKPVLNVTEQARFSGPSPVQFERPPFILNPATGNYEEYSFKQGPLAEIPIDTGASIFWGVIASGGPGTTYQGYVTTDPSQVSNLLNSAQNGSQNQPQLVTIMIINLDPAETLPKGMVLSPLGAGSDGIYYAQPPIWI